MVFWAMCITIPWNFIFNQQDKLLETEAGQTPKEQECFDNDWIGISFRMSWIGNAHHDGRLSL